MNGLRLKLLRGMILVLAVALILIGVYRGEAEEVYTKATTICTSCMGLK